MVVMGKAAHMRLQGGKHFRQRILLSTLSSVPIVITDIRSDDTTPGLLLHEISLLRLVEKISDNCIIEINETGTKLRYKPGVIMGGKHLMHDCGLSQGIGYFLEPLIVLALFGKKPLSIKLKGITNDSRNPSVDTFQSTTFQMLKRFGVPDEGLMLKIENRGIPPLGGGDVVLRIPIIHSSLSAVNWIDEGMVKRIRGTTFSNFISSEVEHQTRKATRGIFNNFIPDVFIHTDHRSGPAAGRSPGYGISITAETTSGCFISADAIVSRGAKLDNFEEEEDKMPPETFGIHIASILLGEIEQGGVVDSMHQGLLFLLCALCPQDVSKVRVGKLTPYAIDTLRNIRDFLGVKFIIEPDPPTNTVILKCLGCGLKNLSRKLS
ncbi:putative RNA 3' terminal phosphate cyclase [Zostera marina]|uniref:Putative RNA 3' terminal phosphate cyclase n=1 Tax=Zostera marina TaxID=29655 RepID=A0A0K9P381_ZOSMR|nr:putative RNA 3' terminal phosphate cyclase [Zostera marina]